MPAVFLTANDLRSGHIVYWTNKGFWSLDPAQALLASTEEGQAALNLIIENPKTELDVVGPYLVTAHEGEITTLQPETPKKLREVRRLIGPEVDLLHIQKAA